jgi:hypothetical protein
MIDRYTKTDVMGNNGGFGKILKAARGCRLRDRNSVGVDVSGNLVLGVADICGVDICDAEEK